MVNYIFEIIGVIVFAILFFAGIVIFLMKRTTSTDKLKISYLLFYLLFPSAEIIFLLFSIWATEKQILPGMLMIAAAIIVGVAGNVILMKYLLVESSKEYLKKRVSEADDLAKKQSELGDKAVTATDIVKAYLSDYDEKVLQIKDMLDEGKSEEAKKLMTEDMDALLSKNEDVLCENTYVSAIISAKKAECVAKGIETDFNVGVPVNIGIDAVEVCSVLGNILDNAINACQKSDIDKKYIKMSVGTRGEYLVIKMTNSADKNSQIQSSDRKHYGQLIVKDYVKKYSGTFEANWNKNEMCYETFIMMLRKGEECSI